MSIIYLKIPSIDELLFRQKWMRDKKTMSYNAGFDMNLKGYNKKDGTIFKTDDEMIEWYYKWIGKEPDRFFSYIYVEDISEPIGEIYYFLHDNIHDMGILIQDKYRKNGYSYEALIELEKIAFEKNNIGELSDYIPVDRLSAIHSFKKAGFVETDFEKVEYVFGKKSIAKQLIITKEMYQKKKMNNMKSTCL